MSKPARISIARFRKWHTDAARRARAAGFDIVYVYAGHDMTPGFDRATTTADDVWYKPYDHDDAGEVIAQHMQDYLTWEVALVEQVARDGDAGFLHPPA